VQNAFVTVVVVVGVVGVLGAVACLLTSRRTWESLGRNRLMMESDLHDRPQAPGGRGAAAPRAAPDTPAARAERDTEVRQMLQARNDRRRRRGQPELDLEAELRRLTATPASPGAVCRRSTSSPRSNGNSRACPEVISRAMADPRRMELDELANRPGTYFHPQTEMLIVVDDGAALDAEIFETDDVEAAEWVLITDEIPVDEHERDALLQAFAVRLEAGAIADADDDDDVENDVLEPDPEEDA
jgi:hypothetical protein